MQASPDTEACLLVRRSPATRELLVGGRRRPADQIADDTTSNSHHPTQSICVPYAEGRVLSDGSYSGMGAVRSAAVSSAAAIWSVRSPTLRHRALWQ